VRDVLGSEAKRVIASIVEAVCRLRQVELRVHDGGACCPCCRDRYKVGPGGLDVRPCPAHARRCEHWEWLYR
jgi:hypothetical protein